MQGDRRETGESAGRRGTTRTTPVLTYILRTLVSIVLLTGVIIFTVRSMRPVYATRGTLGEELRKRAPAVAAAIAPGDSSKIDQLMATPKFQEEKRNFYEDVMRLKQVDSARADSIAQYAVREAYVRGISPAIIFGVMLTENAKFISKATSNVGAVGLMQVYPKIWLNKEMTALFGRDLASDSTNVKYGVFILSQYFRPRTKSGEVRDRDWATALLRYNGCVRGTNTPRCHTYPTKVKSFVENQAKSICDGRGFYECIAKPFIEGLMGTETAKAATPPPAPAVQPRSAAPAEMPAPSTPAPVSPAGAPKPVVASPRASQGRSTTASRRKPATAVRSRKPRAPSRDREALPALPKPITIPVPLR